MCAKQMLCQRYQNTILKLGRSENTLIHDAIIVFVPVPVFLGAFDVPMFPTIFFLCPAFPLQNCFCSLVPEKPLRDPSKFC